MAKREKGLKLPGLGQVGIVVKDLERTMEYYQEVFGIGPWVVSEGGVVWCKRKGEEVDINRNVALAQAGTVQIELVELIEGESIHKEFLGERGEGVHHLGFFVSDFDRRLEAAEKEGIEVLQQGLIKQKGLTVKYAYLDTTEVGGVIIEFIEARFMGIPFPMRSPLLRWGNRVADRVAG